MTSTALKPAAAAVAPEEAGNLTRQVVRRFRSIAPDKQAAARAAALSAFTDWLGVTLAGAREPLVESLVAEAIEEGDGVRPLVGRPERLRLADAVLVNGAASHVLDYDDGMGAFSGHPSVSIASALFGLAAQRGQGGRAFLDAYAEAAEAGGCIGLLVAPDHYGRGFHGTATVGAMAAAAGCARLLELDESRTCAAIGLAAARAAGLKASFGSDAKPLQAGWAAVVGLTAARWAARGVTGAQDPLGDRQGFAATQSRSFDPQAALQPARNGSYAADIVFKPYASCAVTHPVIDLARELRAELGAQAGQVAAVTVRISPEADRICNIAAPRTGMELKFSIRVLSALALAGVDLSDPESFTDEVLVRPELKALSERATVEIDPAWPLWRHGLTLELADGTTLRREIESDTLKASADQRRVQVRRKFGALASRRLGAERSASLLAALDDLESSADMSALAEAVRA